MFEKEDEGVQLVDLVGHIGNKGCDIFIMLSGETMEQAEKRFEVERGYPVEDAQLVVFINDDGD